MRSGSTYSPEATHRGLGERLGVRPQRLGRERADRRLHALVEGAPFRSQRTLDLGERLARRRRVRERLITLCERPAERHEVDAGGADDEPDDQEEHRHEGEGP